MQGLSDIMTGGYARAKATARADQGKGLDEVARQFEAYFLGQMLKSMRDASFGNSLFDSNATRTYQDMFDDQLTLALAGGKGIGLAKVLREQLSRHQGITVMSSEGEVVTQVPRPALSGVNDPGEPPAHEPGAQASSTPGAAASPTASGAVADEKGRGRSELSARQALETLYAPEPAAPGVPASRSPAPTRRAPAGGVEPPPGSDIAPSPAPTQAVSASPVAPVTTSVAAPTRPAVRGPSPALAQSAPREGLAPVSKPPVSKPTTPANRSAQRLRFESPAEFVAAVWPHAERAGAALGVPPEVLVAQSALETGWGKHVMAGPDGRSSSHNLFGIKADRRWDGARTVKRTLEFDGTVMKAVRAPFRAYAGIGESFQDYVRFITGNARYEPALAAGGDPARYVRALQSAGYATDPKYADKILSLMNRGPIRDTAVARTGV